jgi:cytochrome c553
VIEPKLHEQGHNYLVLQLQAYASGERRNDLLARMRTIATRLTQTEINGLAAYYAAGFR